MLKREQKKHIPVIKLIVFTLKTSFNFGEKNSTEPRAFEMYFN